MTSAQLIDVSDFQPPLTKAALTGLAGAFCKATEGLTWTGKTFAPNWSLLGELDMPRGAYHFLHPGEDPVAQARRFCATVKANGVKRGDMLVCDSELMAGVRPASARSHTGITLDRNGILRKVSLPSAAALADVATKAFLDEVAREFDPKRHPIITYTMQSVGQNLRLTAAAHPLLWFAHPSSTAPTAAQIAPFKHWKFWQWGIVHGVDRDAFNGTAADLSQWLSGYEQAGPFRHVADGTKTATQIADGRHTTVEHIGQISAKAYTAADLAAFLKAVSPSKVPAGTPFYTENP